MQNNKNRIRENVVRAFSDYDLKYTRGYLSGEHCQKTIKSSIKHIIGYYQEDRHIIINRSNKMHRRKYEKD